MVRLSQRIVELYSGRRMEIQRMGRMVISLNITAGPRLRMVLLRSYRLTRSSGRPIADNCYQRPQLPYTSSDLPRILRHRSVAHRHLMDQPIELARRIVIVVEIRQSAGPGQENRRQPWQRRHLRCIQQGTEFILTSESQQTRDKETTNILSP